MFHSFIGTWLPFMPIFAAIYFAGYLTSRPAGVGGTKTR